MDLRVYKKEEVLQPHGAEYYYVPNVIDIYPHIGIDGNDGHEILTGADIFTEEKDTIEQECALATIWQRGNDPVDPDVGVRWAEVLLEEGKPLLVRVGLVMRMKYLSGRVFKRRE